MVDPFRNNPDGQRWFLRPSLPVRADRLVITHPHFDHDAVETVSGDPRVIDQRDELRDADYALRICHAADNQAEIDEALRNEIGPIDLLTAAAWLAPLKFFGLALILTGIAFALSAIIKVLCAQA